MAIGRRDEGVVAATHEHCLGELPVAKDQHAPGQRKGGGIDQGVAPVAICKRLKSHGCPADFKSLQPAAMDVNRP